MNSFNNLSSVIANILSPVSLKQNDIICVFAMKWNLATREHILLSNLNKPILPKLSEAAKWILSREN